MNYRFRIPWFNWFRCLDRYFTSGNWTANANEHKHKLECHNVTLSSAENRISQEHFDQGKCHGCCYPGPYLHKNISSIVIGNEWKPKPYHRPGGVSSTCHISFLRSDRKCEYMLMFSRIKSVPKQQLEKICIQDCVHSGIFKLQYQYKIWNSKYIIYLWYEILYLESRVPAQLILW